LTEKQVKAFRIADNKTAELSEWDDELLAMELEGLEDMFTGFSEAEISRLFDPVEAIDLEGEETPRNEQRETYCCPKCGFEFGVEI